MPSRKKAQGKGRKAKRDNAELFRRCKCCWWGNTADFSTQTLCYHGHEHGAEDPKDLAICNEFILNMMRMLESEKSDDIEELPFDFFEKIHCIPERKKMPKKMLVSMAVDFTLKHAVSIDCLSDTATMVNHDVSFVLLTSIVMVAEYDAEKHNPAMYLKIADVSPLTSATRSISSARKFHATVWMSFIPNSSTRVIKDGHSAPIVVSAEDVACNVMPMWRCSVLQS
jgi:hypothetical protein